MTSHTNGSRYYLHYMEEPKVIYQYERYGQKLYTPDVDLAFSRNLDGEVIEIRYSNVESS